MKRSKQAAAPENSVHPLTLAEWRSWLQRHHTRKDGVWLISYKKSANKPRIEYDEQVEEALCFGWVDSKPSKLDEERTMLWFAPRKPGSGWAATNKARIEKLVAAGLMMPAGQAKIDAAIADGSWTLLDAVEKLEIPADLASAFALHAGSQAHFEAFPRSVKRGILEWIQQAKKPETRAKRIDETARLAAQNQRANQFIRKEARP